MIECANCLVNQDKTCDECLNDESCNKDFKNYPECWVCYVKQDNKCIWD